jgi:hypothetical protein
VEARALLGGEIRAPTAGSRVALQVDRADPEKVRLAGDRRPESVDRLTVLLLIALPGAWCTLREVGVRRAEAVARDAGPAFAFLGALAAPRRVGRRATLHLYPLDAQGGARALCAVPLLTTASLPIGGPAFPVEAKGFPRPFGRIVARGGDQVLWPAGRALATTWLPRPEEIAEPVPLDAWGTPPGFARRKGFVRAHLPEIALLAGGLILLSVVAKVTSHHAGEAQRLEREGVPVVAEVVKQGVTFVELTYQLPGQSGSRQGHAPVDYGDRQRVGLRLPAVVNPDRPGQLRLVRERYDAVEPRVWAALPALGAALRLARRAFDWRRSTRMAQKGPWRRVKARRSDRGWRIAVNLGPPDASWSACGVRLAENPAPGLSRRSVVEMFAAGTLEPGSVVALARRGHLLSVVGPAQVPLPPADWKFDLDDEDH